MDTTEQVKTTQESAVKPLGETLEAKTPPSEKVETTASDKRESEVTEEQKPPVDMSVPEVKEFVENLVNESTKKQQAAKDKEVQKHIDEKTKLAKQIETQNARLEELEDAVSTDMRQANLRVYLEKAKEQWEGETPIRIIGTFEEESKMWTNTAIELGKAKRQLEREKTELKNQRESIDKDKLNIRSREIATEYNLTGEDAKEITTQDNEKDMLLLAKDKRHSNLTRKPLTPQEIKRIDSGVKTSATQETLDNLVKKDLRKMNYEQLLEHQKVLEKAMKAARVM